MTRSRAESCGESHQQDELSPRCKAASERSAFLRLRPQAKRTLQTLIAETIKLCDIADTLGRFSPRKEGCMKLAGFLLLLAGWAIVVAAVVLLLPTNARAIFVLAGFGVEIVGLTLVIRSNPLAVGDKE